MSRCKKGEFHAQISPKELVRVQLGKHSHVCCYVDGKFVTTPMRYVDAHTLVPNKIGPQINTARCNKGAAIKRGGGGGAPSSLAIPAHSLLFPCSTHVADL